MIASAQASPQEFLIQYWPRPTGTTPITIIHLRDMNYFLLLKITSMDIDDKLPQPSATEN
jgi:hypothetical protein